MKTTIRAVLVNVSDEQKQIIDNMMLVFCTAVRYSFKRLLEGVEINNLEKDVANGYKS